MQADYRDTLSAAEGRADLVATSPPYDDARTYDNAVTWTAEDYAALGDACFQAVRPGGHVLVVLDGPVRKWRKGMGSERSFTPWKVMLDWAERVGFRVPDRLAYGRYGLPGEYRGRFRNDWEPILWFQKPGGETFFDKFAVAEQAVHASRGGQLTSARTNDGAKRARIATGRAVEEGLRHKGTLWSYGAVGHGHDSDPDAEATDHPARFSIRLADDLVRCFAPKGGLVLDPFLGSGTVAVAALKSGRRFLGGDLFADKAGRPWIDVARERVIRTIRRLAGRPTEPEGAGRVGACALVPARRDEFAAPQTPDQETETGMPRTIGWEDDSVKAGFGGPNKEQQFRGEKGTKHIVRVIGDAQEYRVHKIDDVLEPAEDGEPRAFNMNCAKEWSDEEKDWAGECLACEKDYDVATRYVTGLILLGTQKGKAPKPTVEDPGGCPRFWDFGADKYTKLYEIGQELKRAEKPKKLSQVELVITCEDTGFQKLNIGVSQGAPLTTKEHLAAYKEQGEKLVQECSAAPKPDDMKRRLKKKTKSADDGEAAPAKPAGKPTAKAGAKPTVKAGGKKAPEPEPEEETPAEDDAGELSESTGDPSMDDLLAEIEP